MDNMIVSISELKALVITYTPYSSHPDDAIIILGIRPNKAWTGQYLITYRYLGSNVTYEMSFIGSTPFEIITTLEEVFA